MRQLFLVSGGLGVVALILGLIGGFVAGVQAVPPTEPIEIVVEKEVEKVVEIEVIKEVYKFVNEDNPVHKWVDPANQAVVYIYPEGYTGVVVPMYTLVPPIWYEQILRAFLDMHGGVMPEEVLEAIPKEWLDAVTPTDSKPEANLAY